MHQRAISYLTWDVVIFFIIFSLVIVYLMLSDIALEP